jgi:hypothetical protein
MQGRWGRLDVTLCVHVLCVRLTRVRGGGGGGSEGCCIPLSEEGRSFFCQQSGPSGTSCMCCLDRSSRLEHCHVRHIGERCTCRRVGDVNAATPFSTHPLPVDETTAGRIREMGNVSNWLRLTATREAWWRCSHAAISSTRAPHNSSQISFQRKSDGTHTYLGSAIGLARWALLQCSETGRPQPVQKLHERC